MNLEKDSRKVGNEIKREEDSDGAGRQKKKNGGNVKAQRERNTGKS